MITAALTLTAIGLVSLGLAVILRPPAGQTRDGGVL